MGHSSEDMEVKGEGMRLIDAEAVYKILESCEIRKATIGNPLTDWEYGYTCGIERAESEIECAPTLDAVPVIRCKDCEYYDGYYCHNKYWGDGYGNYTPPIKQEDGFCDWAKRREE